MAKPRIGLLLGDPTGIGPEIGARLLAHPETLKQAEIVVIGDRRLYKQGREIAGVRNIEPEFLECPFAEPEWIVGQVNAAAGRHVLECIREAVSIWKSGRIDAIVFAPLNKQAMKLAGLKHPDELHFLAELAGYVGPISEINICGKLWTSRVTSHIPLKSVAQAITTDRIGEVVRLLHGMLQKNGVLRPRLAVAALNPHAGEGGLFGTEENVLIRPAVLKALENGLDVVGPLPADTIFVAAKRGDFDGVVTMYHDQGQIALKLLGFDRGVTLGGGLPLVTATPAHGTAFDLAGKGQADDSALREAFSTACRLAS